VHAIQVRLSYRQPSDGHGAYGQSADRKRAKRKCPQRQRTRGHRAARGVFE
jgi:hypothetical protein